MLCATTSYTFRSCSIPWNPCAGNSQTCLAQLQCIQKPCWRPFSNSNAHKFHPEEHESPALSETQLPQSRTFFPTAFFKSAPKVKHCAFQRQALAAVLWFFSTLPFNITSRLHHARFSLNRTLADVAFLVLPQLSCAHPNHIYIPPAIPTAIKPAKTQCFVRFVPFIQPLCREIAWNCTWAKEAKEQKSSDLAIGLGSSLVTCWAVDQS